MKTLQEQAKEEMLIDGFGLVTTETATAMLSAIDTLEAEVARLKEAVDYLAGVRDQQSELIERLTATPLSAPKEDVIVAIARALERAEKSPSGYIPAMIANDLQAAGLLSDRERGLEEAAEALRFFIGDDETVEDIIWRDQPDDAMMTVRLPFKYYKQAREAAKKYRSLKRSQEKG